MDAMLAELLDGFGDVGATASAPADLPLDVIGPRSGKGSQQATLDAGADYVARALVGGVTTFYGYRTADARDEHVRQLIGAGIEVHEKIIAARPCRAILEIDAAGDATAEELRAIWQAFVDEAVAIGAPDGAHCPLVLASDRPAKRSRHMLSSTWCLPNGAAVESFRRGVLSRLSGRAVTGNDGKGWLDPRVGATFGLRLPFCAKDGDPATVLLPRGNPSGRLDVASFFAQEDELPVVWPPPECDYELTDEKTGSDIEPIAVDEVALGNYGRLVERIRSEFPHFSAPSPLHINGRAHLIARVDRTQAAHCRACNRSHDKQGAYISADESGRVYLKCYAAGTNALALASEGKPETPENKDEEKDEAEADAPDEYDILVGARRIRCQYNSDGIEDDHGRDLYAGSSWKTGKTKHIRDIILATLARNPRARILIISARISYSVKACEDFGAVSYKKIKGMLNVNATPVSVWQLDSLKRIPSDTVFDLVVCDEVAQIVAHALMAAEKGGKAQAGMSSLRCLLEKAGRVLACDNDLTAAHVEALRRTRPGKPCQVIRNDFQPFGADEGTGREAVPVTIRTGMYTPPREEGKRPHKLTAEDYVTEELFAWADAEKAKKDNGEEWHGCVIPCHALARSRQIRAKAIARYGADLVRWYASGSDDVARKADCADITKAWSGALVIIYTSTITVGIDFNHPHVSRCFAFFKSGNVAATQSAQMLFRCRQLSHITIAYRGATGLRNFPRTVPKLLAWVTMAKNRGCIPDCFRRDRAPLITEPTESDPAALARAVDGFEGRMWVCAALDKFRSERGFLQRLTSILERAGLVVSTGAPTQEVVVTALVPSSGEELPPLEQLMAGNVLEAVARHERALESPDQPDEAADRTEPQKAGDDCRMLCEEMKADPAHAAETPAWVAYWQPHLTKLKRRNKTISGRLRGYKGLATTSEVEPGNMTRRVFALAGCSVRDACVESVRVECAALATPEAFALSAEINKNARRAFGDDNAAKRAKTKNKEKAVVTTLNVALRHIGAKFVAVYASAKAQKEGKVSHHVVQWEWDPASDEDFAAINPLPALPDEPPDAAGAFE